MVLGLIGMSCVGKSYWADKLSAAGLRCLRGDDLITEQLSAELGRAPMTQTEIGAWLGMPDEPPYRERQARYISCEEAALRRILALLDQGADDGRDTVVDTGGSLIYLADDLLAALRQRVRLVYLAITPQIHTHMLADYLARPRALLWGELFQPAPGERRADTFARCYPHLIAWRERRYAALSHVTLGYDFHRTPGQTADSFLRRVHACGETRVDTLPEI